MGFPWKSPEPSGKYAMTQAKPGVSVAQKPLSITQYNNAFPLHVPEGASEDHPSLVAKKCFAMCEGNANEW